MADAAPPANVNDGSVLGSTKNNAAAAYNSVTNGPVGQNVKDQAAKTSSEFSNLAASRKTPQNSAATGQALTHYHSFFSELLSWKNPRASAIAYSSIVALIFAARYLDIIRWAFRLSWIVLGTTVAAEAAGKLVFNHGLTSQFRPRRYYTVSRETLDGMIGDVHELVNFFVIEAQRIVFAENVGASAAAALTTFIAYFLVKIVPYWGLAIIGTTLAFFIPLVYTSNQELIDQHLKNASDVINAQTAQVRGVAQQQAEQLSALGKQYAGDYTSKVQEMLGGRGTAKPIEKPVSGSNFPTPPTEEPSKAPVPQGTVSESEPLIAS